jgi:hypothetical protein
MKLVHTMYCCPACGAFSRFHMEGHSLICFCGAAYRLDENDLLVSDGGRRREAEGPGPATENERSARLSLPARLSELEEWQSVRRAEALAVLQPDAPALFFDDHLVLYLLEQEGRGATAIAEGRLSFFVNRLEFYFGHDTYLWRLDEISGFKLISPKKLRFNTIDAVFELRARFETCLGKYVVR